MHAMKKANAFNGNSNCNYPVRTPIQDGWIRSGLDRRATCTPPYEVAKPDLRLAAK